jgi:hypothetical protein
MITKISTKTNINTMAKQVPAIKWKVLIEGNGCKNKANLYPNIYFKVLFLSNQTKYEKGPLICP